LFFFILLLLASFYRKYKKISSFIVVIFTCLLFSLTKMSNPEEMIFTFKQKSEESFEEAWSRIYDSQGRTEPSPSFAC
jgi:hypothetical protein